MAGALIAFFPLATYALGLGKLTVRSALNEPLNAEIEITSVSDKELKGLQVALAPRSDFDQAGISKLPFLADIKFMVSKRANGNYFVQLSTDQQIDEPFLQILLTIDWPGGRLVREYTALIDPPVQIAGRPTGIEPPSASAPAVVSAAKPPEQPKAESVESDSEKEKEQASPAQPPPAETPQAPAANTARPQVPAQETESQSNQPAQVAVIPAAPRSDSKPVVEELGPSPSRSAAPAASGRIVDGGYTVQRGDTAWRIAEQARPDNSYSIEQVVLALFRANPQAFFGGNVNNLKAGQILKLPESGEIDALPALQARTQFRAQYDAWLEYKVKLAGAASAIKVVENEPRPVAPPVPTKSEVAPVKKQAEKKEAEKAPPEQVAKAPADNAERQQELLKIVRSTTRGDKTTPDKKPADGETRKDASTKEHQALADRVSTLEESLASRQVQTKELSDKVAQVRAQLKREARLIQIEQKDLATAQTRAKPETAKPAQAPPKLEAKPDTKTEVATAQPTVPKPEQKIAEPPKVEKPIEAPPPVKKPDVASTPAKAAPPPPVEEKGFLSELLDSILDGDSSLPVILGGVVLLSGVIALVYMNRRRKSIAEFEESILQSDVITGQSGDSAVTTDTSGQVVSTGDTSFLSDFSQGGMGNIHTDEVDPIAEAEVYLAYGRDETAEEILKEAIVKNPGREELKLKLLEIYSNRSDVRAFETLAEEMYAAMSGRPSKNWARVEELGRKLNPENPLFRGGAASAAKPAASGFSDTAKMKATIPPAAKTMADTHTNLTSPVSEMPSAGSDLDFDLGDAAPSTASADRGFDVDFGEAASKTGGDGLEFSENSDLTSSGSGLESSDFGKPSSNVIDFDFGEKKEPGQASATDTDVAVAEARSGDTGESPQWDETATKLDLARAYIDMGDAEGARSILQEVMAEGSDQQKKQAKELAAQIG